MHDDWVHLMERIMAEERTRKKSYKHFLLWDAWYGPLEEKPQRELDEWLARMA